MFCISFLSYDGSFIKLVLSHWTRFVKGALIDYINPADASILCYKGCQ